MTKPNTKETHANVYVVGHEVFSKDLKAFFAQPEQVAADKKRRAEDIMTYATSPQYLAKNKLEGLSFA